MKEISFFEVRILQFCVVALFIWVVMLQIFILTSNDSDVSGGSGCSKSHTHFVPTYEAYEYTYAERSSNC